MMDIRGLLMPYLQQVLQRQSMGQTAPAIPTQPSIGMLSPALVNSAPTGGQGGLLRIAGMPDINIIGTAQQQTAPQRFGPNPAGFENYMLPVASNYQEYQQGAVSPAQAKARQTGIPVSPYNDPFDPLWASKYTHTLY